MGSEYLKMDKRAQSQVVTAVLLILIVIALAVLILNFSTNFVKDRLGGTGCFDTVGQVSFTGSNRYTCFNNSDIGGNPDMDELRLQVHIGDVNSSISGFLIEIGGADTKSIKIEDGEDVTGVSMYSGIASLELPGKNEERTYVFDVSVVPESVKIYPILNDEDVCEASDVLEKVIACR